MQQRILANERRAKDRRALEAYEKRNTDVAHWVDDIAVPPNPDNAAILYYQAFLLRPDPNEAIDGKIHSMFSGGGPDREVRTYLGHCLLMMQVAETASKLPQCDWGIWHGRGRKFGENDLYSQVSYLRDILSVDARTLAADGQYHAALERCLMLRRLAGHLSGVSELDLVSRSVDAMALRTAQHVLGVMPPDMDILAWFRGRLVVVQGASLGFAEMLQLNFKSFLDRVRLNPARLRYLKYQLVQKVAGEQAGKGSQNLTDEQLLSRMQAPFPRFFNSIFQILDGDMSYEQKCAQMRELSKNLTNEYGDEPVVAYVIASSGTDSLVDYTGHYALHVGHAAHVNGIKVAVEVYLVLAKTGKLPEKLPDHLPKDPFTGKDFGYEITDEGFALRCAGEDFKKRKKSLLEFRVYR